MNDRNWRDRAACKDIADAELFFPVGETGPALFQIEHARMICAYCPVQRACLDTAMSLEGGGARDTRHGMWGGLHGTERHNLYVRRSRHRLKQDAS